MTRNEIIAKWDGMSARERDAWVAEVVFGYEVYGGFYVKNGVRVFYPFYTTDISAAWPILSEFKAYEISGFNYHTCKLWARIYPEYYEAQTESAPEAICLAALIAKLSEEVT